MKLWWQNWYKWNLLICLYLDACSFHQCKSYQDCVVVSNAAKCQCPTCRSPVDPVCASNGKPYPSECLMRIKACKTKRELVVVNKGSCGTECTMHKHLWLELRLKWCPNLFHKSYSWTSILRSSISRYSRFHDQHSVSGQKFLINLEFVYNDIPI